MTSSPKRPGSDDLPPALSSMWRLCKLGYRHEPGLMLVGVRAVAALGAARRAAGALVQADRRRRAAARRGLVRIAAVALGVSATGHVVSPHGQHARAAPLPRQGHDRARVARRAAPGVDRDHRASGAPGLSRPARDAARSGVRARPHVHVGVFHVRVDPAARRHDRAADVDSSGARAARGVRGADGAHVDVAAGRRARRAGAGRAVQPPRPSSVHHRDDRAARQGSARHRHRRAPGPSSAARRGSRGLVRCRRCAGDRPRGTRSRGRSSARPTSAPSCSCPLGLRSSAGNVLLVLAAGARLSAYIGATVGEIGFLRGFWMDGSRRLAWLEDYAASLVASADLPVPARLDRGIRFEHVSFAYPGTDRLVLDDVNLDLPAGTVVAVVGENGAGKSTLVKLLAKLYEPTQRPHPHRRRRSRAHARRRVARRLAGAFQDFFRFEFRARHSVGVGDVPRLDDEPAVVTAVGRAGADDVIVRLTAGLDTQLGPTWPGGVEVSFGQWQKLALARGFMRDGPLLLVLDEPTAALDAETEHALFERYAAAARRSPGRCRAHHDPRVAPLLHGPHGRSHRRARRRPRRRGRYARGADGEGRASTPSSTASRRRPTAEIRWYLFSWLVARGSWLVARGSTHDRRG